MIIADCRNKKGGDDLRPFLIASCRMRRERLIRPTKTCKFNILQESRRPDKRSATGTLAWLTPLNIDIRRFQGVLFNKRTARFNGVAHQRGEQLVGSNRIFKDRKSTRLNSSHVSISYAVFCLKKKKKRI